MRSRFIPNFNLRFFTPLALLGLFAGLVIGCEDQVSPTLVGPDPSNEDSPALAISDAIHGDPGERNPHFYFRGLWFGGYHETNGEFDPGLDPVVEVCAWDGEGEWTEEECRHVVTFTSEGRRRSRVVVDKRAEVYKVRWSLRNYDLDPDLLYRIRVTVGETQLGYADMQVWRRFRELFRIDLDEFIPIYEHRWNMWIRFRIEEGALCDPEAEQCAAEEVDAETGGTVTLEETGELVDIPPQDGGFIVNDGEGGTTEVPSVTVVVQSCIAPDTILPIDIPQYGSCLEIRTEPPLAANLDSAAIVAVCEFDFDDVPPLAGGHDQEHLVTMHRWDEDEDKVYALPHADYLCLPESNGLEGSSGPMRFARAALRGLKQIVTPEPLVAAPPVAMHRGPAGRTGGFSKFRLALPSKIEVYSGDGQAAYVNSPLPEMPTVFVSDLNGGPVADARVEFEVTLGGGTVDSVEAWTDEYGLARAGEWTVGGMVGLNLLSARGRGLAGPENNGPRGEVDPFQPWDPIFDYPLPQNADTTEQIELEVGQVEFSAAAAEEGNLCGEGDNCEAGVADAKDGGTIQLGQDLVDLPPQGDGFLVQDGMGGSAAVQALTVVVEECEYPGELPIDIPQFGSCLDIRTEPPLADTLETAATVAVCSFDFGDIPKLYDHDQEHLVTLHKWDEVNDVVYALPHASYECSIGSNDGSEPGPVMRFAQNGLEQLVNLVSPSPLHAAPPVVMHRGPAGRTTGFSKFRLALPAKMDAVYGGSFSSPLSAATVAPPGPSVLVTDLLGNPVEDAIVRFAVTGSFDSVEVFSDQNGLAELKPWTLGIPGAKAISASGLGIGAPNDNGPRPILDPFQPWDDGFDMTIPDTADALLPEPLGEGVVDFAGEGTADLVVYTFSHTPKNPTAGEEITFTAVVKNLGTGIAGPSTLLFKVGGETPGADGTLFATPALGPHQRYTVERTLTLIPQAYLNTATADYENDVAEVDEENNTETDSYTVSN